MATLKKTLVILREIDAKAPGLISNLCVASVWYPCKGERAEWYRSLVRHSGLVLTSKGCVLLGRWCTCDLSLSLNLLALPLVPLLFID